MKDFLKMTLAVIVGMIIVSILSSMLVLGIIGSVAAIGSASKPALPKSGVLTMDFSKLSIEEQSVESNPLESVYKQDGLARIGVWDAVQAINAAADDPSVQFIFLKPDDSVTGLANLSEIRKSLEKFRKSGKPVVSYVEAPSTGSYYLASVADKVYMTAHPGSMVSITGVSSQLIFLKDLLDKLGVNVQLIRHGKYKSAGEMFIKSEPSAENREQYQVMVNSLWGAISAEIAQSRDISVDNLNSAVDGLKLNLPQDLVDAGLVDELLTRDQLQDKLAALAVVDNYKDVKKIDFADYVSARILPGRSHKKIAVIYANGDIVDGTDKRDVAGDRFASIIEKVRRDSTVKAVVLRVNSPGGAVLGADKIKHELDLLKRSKPLIASYGDFAASGGYWISAGADKVFSDAVTLTGSIGVFSILPDFSKTAKNVAHVSVTSINSNKHGDMLSLMRPLDNDEYAYMLRSVEDIYDRFTTIVAEGRGMEQSAVDEIGQGRVWAGADAVNIGLVDEIGTLEDAIQYAASCADDPDISNWTVKGYPKPLSMMEEMMSYLNGINEDEVSAALRRFGGLTEIRTEARMPYEISLQF